jgi:hypothetical protein
MSRIHQIVTPQCDRHGDGGHRPPGSNGCRASSHYAPSHGEGRSCLTPILCRRCLGRSPCQSVGQCSRRFVSRHRFILASVNRALALVRFRRKILQRGRVIFRPRRQQALPGIAQLEVRIGVLVAVPRGVMVRCVDVHSGRPVLKARTELSQSDFSRAFLKGNPERKCDTCQGNPSQQNDRSDACSQYQCSRHEVILSDVSGQVRGQPRTRMSRRPTAPGLGEPIRDHPIFAMFTPCCNPIAARNLRGVGVNPISGGGMCCVPVGSGGEIWRRHWWSKG